MRVVESDDAETIRAHYEQKIQDIQRAADAGAEERRKILFDTTTSFKNEKEAYKAHLEKEKEAFKASLVADYERAVGEATTRAETESRKLREEMRALRDSLQAESQVS